MRRRLWLPALTVLLVVVGVGSYLRWHRSGAPSPGAAPPARTATPKAAPAMERLPVKTARVEKRDLEVTLPVFGAINFLEKVEVASEINGVLKEAPVQTGDQVTKGQVVAVMDTELLQGELKTKAALKAQAEALLQLAAWHHQAQRKVYQVGGIPLKDLEEAEARYREKRAEVARYGAEMAQTQIQIRKATITSPITGIVGQKNYQPGERVTSQSEKGVVTLIRTDEVYAEAEVNERDLARLRPGLEANVIPDAYAQIPLRGRIERLEPALKPESRSVIAKVRLPNPQGLLKPGMFSRIDIILDTAPQVTAIPAAALRPAADKTWQVFVITDEVAFSRKVVVGLTTARWAEIKEGLRPGEAVVIEGAERLKDLARVVSRPISPHEP